MAKLKFLTLIKGDQTILEKQPLESACRQKELMAFEHFGFWKCMDTKRDRDVMNEILKKKI